MKKLLSTYKHSELTIEEVKMANRFVFLGSRIYKDAQYAGEIKMK